MEQAQTQEQEELKLKQAQAIYEEWQLSLKSEASRENYANHVKYFCAFHNVNHTDLIGKTKLELKDMLKRYLLHLKKNAVNTPTKRTRGQIHINSLIIYIAGVKSYIQYILGEDEDIKFTKIDDMLPEQMMTEIRAYTREEIQKLVSLANPRVRVIMYIMLSGGVRVGGLAGLRVKDFSLFDKDYNIGMLHIYANSKKWHYFTLLTPEATAAVQDYLQWRDENGEHPVKPESPLIRDKFDVFTESRIHPLPTTRDAITSLMRRLVAQAGIRDPTLAPDHSFRHFWVTMMVNADVNEKYKMYWQGLKKNLGLDIRYFDPKNPDTHDRMLTEYMKAVDYLTISDTNRVKLENEQLRVKRDEFDELRATVESIKKDKGKG